MAFPTAILPTQKPLRLLVLVSCLILIGASGCHRRVVRVQAPPLPKPEASPSPATSVLPMEEKEGLASWYGHPYHGRQTTSGEIYNMNDFTAAHRTLPFNTMVQVHNLENGKEVQVRINDRGPFVNGRIIDLSLAAARQIDLIGPGTCRVRLDLLKQVDTTQPLALQAGSFKEKTNAERLKKLLESTWQPVIIQLVEDERGTFYRVFAGQFSDYSQAVQQLKKLREKQQQGFIVRLDSPPSSN